MLVVDSEDDNQFDFGELRLNVQIERLQVDDGKLIKWINVGC